MKKLPWHFRKNTHRKSGGRKSGSHPSLVFGESDDGSKYYNLGLTHSKKRGHHTNVKIHNPKDWSKYSYIRDDIQLDQNEYLSKVLEDFHLCPEDIEKIYEIIKKKNPH